MDPSTYRGLTFLLSLGSLPIACNPDKGDTTDSGTGDSATTGGDSTGATTGGTTAITGNESSSNVASDSGPTEGGTGDGTTSGGTGDVCEAYADHLLQCSPMAPTTKAEAIAECENQRTMFGTINGPACLALYDAYQGCLATSPCDATDPCVDEANAALGCLPEPGDVCKAFAAKYVECVPGYDASMAAGYCQSYINFGTFTDGPACGAVIEELQACLSTLACADLETGTGCEAQQMAVDMNCGFGGGPPAEPFPRRRLVSR